MYIRRRNMQRNRKSSTWSPENGVLPAPEDTGAISEAERELNKKCVSQIVLEDFCVTSDDSSDDSVHRFVNKRPRKRHYNTRARVDDERTRIPELQRNDEKENNQSLRRSTRVSRPPVDKTGYDELMNVRILSDVEIEKFNRVSNERPLKRKTKSQGLLRDSKPKSNADPIREYNNQLMLPKIKKGVKEKVDTREGVVIVESHNNLMTDIDISERADLVTKQKDITIYEQFNNEDSDSCAGFIEVVPGAKKTGQVSWKYSFYFCVVEGVAEIGLEHLAKKLKAGEPFYIPKGKHYFITNVSDFEVLRLFYVKIVPHK